MYFRPFKDDLTYERKDRPASRQAHLASPPLLGQSVLVTTLNRDGMSNLASKSWLSMIALDPPIFALGCNLKHWTAENILARKDFIVNVPGAELDKVVWEGVRCRIHVRWRLRS